MGSRFDFQSPGAAFVDTMAKVLAERKAEERQQMLDRLTQSADARAEKAEERANANAATQRDWQNFQITSGRATMDREELTTAAAQLDPGIDPSTQFPPEMLERLVKGGYIIKNNQRPPQPSVSTNESFAPPPGADGVDPPEVPDSEPWLGGFTQGGPAATSAPLAPAPKPEAPAQPGYRAIGDKQYREDEREKTELGRVIMSMVTSDDPKVREQGKRLAIVSSLLRGKLTGADVNREIPQDSPLYTVNPDTGVATNRGNIPGNAQTVVLPQDRNSGGRLRVKSGVNKDGFTIYVDEFGNETIGTNKITDPTETPAGIPVGITTRLDEIAAVMVTDPSDPVSINNYKTSAKRALTYAKQGNQKVKSWVSRFIDNPAAATQELTQNPLTPEEQADADMLLNAVGARDYTAILMMPTPKPKAPEKSGGWGGLSDWLGGRE
jgi:hypothetical protein